MGDAVQEKSKELKILEVLCTEKFGVTFSSCKLYPVTPWLSQTLSSPPVRKVYRPHNKLPSPQSFMRYTGKEEEVTLQISQSIEIPSPWPLVLCFVTHNSKASQSHLQQSKSKVLSLSPEMSLFDFSFFLTKKVYWWYKCEGKCYS